jgi:DDE superfamily endonuclease
MDPSRFVFLDETGATTNMVRRYGRCLRGERLVDATPWGHWRTTTFVAGLRASGVIAPLVLDGPMTGEVFRAYVEQMLAPSLEPGDVVVLDNLAAHQVAGVAEAIRAVGASLLYLPPHSPGPEPHRAALRQAQGAPPDSGCCNLRGPLGHHRCSSTSSSPLSARTTSSTAATVQRKTNLL